MIESLVSWGEIGAFWTLVAFTRTLPLLAIVYVASMFLRRRIAARYQFMLWMVVGLRMLLPFSVPAPFSIQGLSEHLVSGLLSVEQRSVGPQPYDLTYDTQQIPEGAHSELAMVMDVSPETTPVPMAEVVAFDWDVMILNLLVGIWGVGAILMLGRGVIAYLRFLQRMNSSSEITSSSLRTILLEECDAIGLRRPRVVEMASLSSPAMFGIWKATICLPVNLVEQNSRQQIRWILRHELAHIKRGDAFWLSLVFFMRALHWYNPLAWFVAARLQLLAEESADEVAVRNTHVDQWTDYARMLLKFAEGGPQKNPAAVIGRLCMASGSGLPQRITMLVQRRPSRRGIVRGLIGLSVVGLAVVGLTDRKVAAEAEYYIENAAAHSQRIPINVSAKLPNAGEASPHTRDVSKLLTRLEDEHGIPDPELFLKRMIEAGSGQSVSLKEGSLTLFHSESGIAEVDRLLAALLESGPRQVVVDCLVWQGEFPAGDPDGWFRHRVKTVRGSMEQWPVVAAKLSADQATKIHQNCPGQKLSAPRLMLLAGTTGSIASGTQTPFVTDVTPVDDAVLEPVISEVTEGWQIQVRASAGENDACDLKCILSSTAIDKVQYADIIPYSHTDAFQEKVTVQVPSVRRSSAQADTALASDEHLLLAIPTPYDDEKHVGPSKATFYLISPRLVSKQETLEQLAP